MTVVFVHGVPETPAVWRSLRCHLPVDSVALRLPGFGSVWPLSMTDKDAYAGWLASRLREFTEPVDLVGHDWGGHLAMRLVSACPEVPVRSWVSDVAYGWHPDHLWHGASRWQKQVVVPGTFGRLLAPRGVPADVGAEIDAAHDEAMSRAVLALCRSARPNLYEDWGAAVTAPVAAPGLVLVPTGDLPPGAWARNEDVARRFGARVERLDGLSHYWMLDDPPRAAQVLQRFWADPRP
ncbi:alpha/beta hydrolase [Paractinoplanes abujensis]|uniref:Pimeloyl-ACP methyl ester carboxylesterase n=1 Tax=Paractinoplanes abujensis TaxID=882441 RepID=A0A7W7CR36_9ACTN|nr:alpha/beta hydrolase [Actinoplanes abujensis]MBB4693132.1 pimeloyl-ACP methyl ester carboxylesterase [Actinoplanes abujensis]GID24962.1 alpha/beta hydrolase [Actinoplanes abujensis]